MLNPVIAALVVNRTDSTPAHDPLRTDDRIRYHESRMFALEWLRSDLDCSTPPLVRDEGSGQLPAVPPLRLLPRRDKLRIGLVGMNSAFGLGHLNRDIVKHLPIERWLMPSAGVAFSNDRRWRIDVVPRSLSVPELEAWLSGLDLVLFAESPVFPMLTSVARGMGIRVVCIPNWEWLHPGLDWLRDVDMMLCPARFAFLKLSEWKRRFLFSWAVTHVDWPIDAAAFVYRNLRFCRRFVFVNGSGGAAAYREKTANQSIRRKGLEVLLQAAELIPEIPITVYAFPTDVPSRSSNVEVRLPPDDNRLLYCDGDVCVQPSHWEGLGLPLLECQAAGLPLVTTEAPPMNEHSPLACIPVSETAPVFLSEQLCIPAAVIHPERLAVTLESVFATNISRPSRQARKFIEKHHNWSTAGPAILNLLNGLHSNR